MSKAEVVEKVAMRLADLNAKIIALGAEREKALADLKAACGEEMGRSTVRAHVLARKPRAKKAKGVKASRGKNTGVTKRALEFVTRSEEPVTSAEIGKALGIPPNAAFSLLGSAIKKGLVAKEKGERGVTFRRIVETLTSSEAPVSVQA